jgi:hypothetical protein
VLGNKEDEKGPTRGKKKKKGKELTRKIAEPWSVIHTLEPLKSTNVADGSGPCVVGGKMSKRNNTRLRE